MNNVSLLSATVLWLFAEVIFVTNFFIRFPFAPARDISEFGVDCIDGFKAWYTLTENSYTVLEVGESVTKHKSGLYRSPIHLTYFLVEVSTDNGAEEIWVRVTEEKEHLLESGFSPELYGMVSVEEFGHCVNDNGDTISSRTVSAFLCLVAAVLSFGLSILTVFFLIKRHSLL